MILPIQIQNLIEKYKSQYNIVGEDEEILKKIDMVANDMAFGQGMCGAASGSIRTNVGQPTIRVSEITVGGRGGELK